MEEESSKYWDDKASAWTFYNCSKKYLQNYEETAVTMILDYYRQKHPQWAPGQSKIPVIVDVGCGNGQLSVRLAEHCDRLIAVDISSAQIEVAKEVNSRPNIEYVVGMAETLSEVCSLESVDLITVGTAVQYFDSNNHFFEEFKMCLRTGGVFVIVSYINWGIDLEDEYYQSYFIRTWQEYSKYDQISRAMSFHANSFSNFEVPDGSSYEEKIIRMRWSIDDIKVYNTAFSHLFKSTFVEKLVEGLPPMESYEILRHVYCIQWCKMQPQEGERASQSAWECSS